MSRDFYFNIRPDTNSQRHAGPYLGIRVIVKADNAALHTHFYFGIVSVISKAQVGFSATAIASPSTESGLVGLAVASAVAEVASVVDASIGAASISATSGDIAVSDGRIVEVGKV